MPPKVKISVKNADALRKLAEIAKPAETKTSFKVGIIDDPEVATYAAYNEFGWVQQVTRKQSAFLSGVLGYDVKSRGFENAPFKPGNTLSSPPRPFLRGTASAKKDEWRDMIAEGISTLGVKALPQIMELTARQAQVDVQETIKNNGTDKEKFPARSPVTLELYKAMYGTTAKGRPRKIESDSGMAREQALFLSGTLLQSIGYEIK